MVGSPRCDRGGGALAGLTGLLCDLGGRVVFVVPPGRSLCTVILSHQSAHVLWPALLKRYLYPPQTIVGKAFC